MIGGFPTEDDMDQELAQMRAEIPNVLAEFDAGTPEEKALTIKGVEGVKAMFDEMLAEMKKRIQ